MRSLRLLLPAVFLFALAATADTLYLSDGSKIDGKVTFCDEETCTIDKKPVAIASIKRIAFAQNTLLPKSGVRGPALLLTDGSLRRGRFTGLTLGYVEIEGEEIDRETVAMVILGDVAGTRDVLVTPEATERLGAVTTCNAASCTFDGSIVPFTRIRWIGLGQEGKAPPSGVPEDAIVIEGEDPVAARLTSLDDANVGTDKGSFARERVQWIRIAAPKASQPKGPGAVGAPPSRPPPPPAAGIPPGTPPSTRNAPPGSPGSSPANPSTPQTPAMPDGTPRRGALWTGQMQARGWGNVDGIFNDVQITVDVRMREYIIPLVEWTGATARTIGTIARLEPEGSVVTNNYTCSGQGLSCSGQGTTTVTIGYDQNGIGHPSVVIHKNKPGTMTGFGFELEVGQGVYVIVVPTSETYDVTYQTDVVTHSDSGYFTPMAGLYPANPITPCSDDQVRYLEGGRMSGSFTVQCTGAFPQFSASWSVCREGVACPPPPALPEDDSPLPPRDLPPEENPCDELERLQRAMRELKNTYELFESDAQEAERQRDEARDKIWGFDGALRKYFTSMLALAARGGSAAVQTAISRAKALMDISGEGDAKDALRAAKALGYGPETILTNAATKEAIRAAIRNADAYLAQTGDHQGALRVYAGSIERSQQLANTAKTITKGVGAVGAAADYAAKTMKLADLIQEWLDHNADATRAKGQMEDINEKMRDLQLRIDEARRRCAARSSELGHPRHPGLVLVSSTTLPLAATQSQQSDPAAIAARLRATEQQLNALPQEYEEAAVWLLPFLADETEGVSGEMLAALLGAAVPHLETIRHTLDGVQTDAPAFERELEGAIPKATSTPAKPRS